MTASLYHLEKWMQVRLGGHPRLYYPLYRLFRGQPQQVIHPESDLLIEGYPRSANSFAVTALRNAQPRPVRIASHLHVPAQIIRAAQWGIPTLVLIRTPEEAVASFMLRDPISPSLALRYYLAFYETAMHYREAFSLATFDEVIEDYPAVVARLNSRWGTQFVLPPHDTASVQQTFRQIEDNYRKGFRSLRKLENAVSTPSAARQCRKEKILEQLSRTPTLQGLLERARNIHASLTAGNQGGSRRPPRDRGTKRQSAS